MRPSAFAATAASPLLVTLFAVTGCQRGEDAPPATPAPGASAAQQRAAAPAAIEPTDLPPPEGVLRAYVWDCDGGLTLRMTNLYREDAIALEMHEGARRLPRVASASGAKYSDGSLTFWIRGDSAILERQGAAPVDCRESRQASLLADARARGVRYRGHGNEPGWTVEIGPGARVEFVTGYGADRHVFDAATESGGETADARVFRAGRGDQGIEVSVSTAACADDMSGEQFGQLVIVEFGGRTLRGCGTAIP